MLRVCWVCAVCALRELSVCLWLLWDRVPSAGYQCRSRRERMNLRIAVPFEWRIHLNASHGSALSCMPVTRVKLMWCL